MTQDINVDVSNIYLHRGRFVTIWASIGSGPATQIEVHIDSSGCCKILMTEDGFKKVRIEKFSDVYDLNINKRHYDGDNQR